MPVSQEIRPPYDPSEGKIPDYINSKLPQLKLVSNHIANAHGFLRTTSGRMPTESGSILYGYRPVEDLGEVAVVDNNDHRIKLLTLTSDLSFDYVRDIGWKENVKVLFGSRPRVEVDLGDFIGIRYSVGDLLVEKGEEGKTIGRFQPNLTSTILAMMDDSGNYNVRQIMHESTYSNLTTKKMRLENSINGIVKKDGTFDFSIVMTANVGQGVDHTASIFSRIYKQEERKGEKVYVGHEGQVENMIGYNAPEVLKVGVSEEEMKNYLQARGDLARLSIHLPNSFSHEQLQVMFQNLVDGKVMTAGVWDPLTIPGMRSESFKTYSEAKRHKMRARAKIEKEERLKNPKNLGPESTPGNN